MSALVQTWEVDSPSLGKSVVAMGVFDGVHIGHQALIRDAVAKARESDVTAVALTFDRDPDQVVTPQSAAPQLLTLPDKIEAISELGVDAVLIVPFCTRLAETEPDRFLDDVLTQALDPIAVVVGRDFRFGHRASGTVKTLQTFGEEHGFEVVAHELVLHDGDPVSSTRIRTLVAGGSVEEAAVLLGRPHRMHGRVGRGRGAGEPLLGVPTANIRPGTHSAVPADGVYAGYVVLADGRHPAAISVGLPPTFPEARDTVEAHLIGWNGDLYNTYVALEYVARLRDQHAFDSLETLASQIRGDLERASEILEKLHWKDAHTHRTETP